MRILFNPSDSKTELLYKSALERMLHNVTLIRDQSILSETVKIYDFDLILLDLPNFRQDDRLLALIKECRAATSKALIFVLSGPGHYDDRLTALQHGAHDCLIGPPDIQKFEIVTNSLLSRVDTQVAEETPNNLLSLDKTMQAANMDGIQIRLTPKEFVLLELLLRQTGKIVTSEVILSHIFKIEDFSDPKLIHPHICRLRAKLKHPDIKIKSEYGIGYMISIRA